MLPPEPHNPRILGSRDQQPELLAVRDARARSGSVVSSTPNGVSRDDMTSVSTRPKPRVPRERASLFHETFVEEVYPLSGNFKPPTRRQRVVNWLALTDVGLWLEVFFVTITVLSIVEFVIATYFSNLAINIIEYLFAAFFISEWLFHFALSSHKIRFIFSWLTIIDILATVPILIQSATSVNLQWFRAARVLRFTRILGSNRLPFCKNAIHRQVAQLFLSIFIVIFLSAAAVNAAELNNFFLSLYFVTVTLATVGFGDVTLKTTLGRLIVIATIIGAAILLPVQAFLLSRLIASVNPYAGSYRPVARTHHAVVTGVPTLSNDRMPRMLEQIFHRSSRTSSNVHLVVMASDKPPQSVASLFLSDWIRKKVCWLTGDLQRISDLHRAAAQDADSFVILADPWCKDLDEADRYSALLARSVRDTIPTVSVVVQFNSRLNVELFRGKSLQYICYDSFITALLARDFAVPGIIALLSGFITNVYVKEKTLLNHSKELKWQGEYYLGRANQIFIVSPPADLIGVKMKVAVFLLKRSYHSLLLGIVDKHGRVTLNPDREFEISTGVSLVCLARNWKSVRNITKKETVDNLEDIDKSIVSMLDVSSPSPSLSSPSPSPSLSFSSSSSSSSSSSQSASHTDFRFPSPPSEVRLPLGHGRLSCSLSSPRVAFEGNCVQRESFALKEKNCINPIQGLFISSAPADIANHIIIFTHTLSASTLISELREQKESATTPIFIVCTEIAVSLLAELVSYQQVFVIKGSPQHWAVVSLAMPHTASRIYIIATTGHGTELADPCTVLTHRCLKDHLKNQSRVRIIAEVAYPSASRLLGSKQVKHSNEFLQSRRCTCTGLLWSKAVHAIGCAKILPPSRAEENSDVEERRRGDLLFAGGHICESAWLFDAVAVQSVSNPFISKIIDALVSIKSPSRVQLQDIPFRFQRKPYLELFTYLIHECGELPVGLWREITDSEERFVFANPPAAVLMYVPCLLQAFDHPNDKVYLLGCGVLPTKVPKE